ncbi:hypothetical protein CRENBAI_008673 [Crenichthys baileyi]|uniref:Uncharacterized protein n=1 Tax=Crenichthys baileyi TaxID=28760 RepID=A0AAV9RSA5_9TELE
MQTHPTSLPKTEPGPLDTQVESAPPPPTDPPPSQQNALLEGESTCNEMVPTHQFRRPLSPPMYQRPPGQDRVPEHALAQNSATFPPRPKPPGPAGTPARARHGPGTQSPQDHPRPAQEQHSH